MRVDVSIVGGGVVGGSLALALAAAGMQVALVDPRIQSEPKPRPFDLRVYALRPSSIEFLRHCGLWSLVDETRIAPVYEMAVRGDDGASTLSFDAYRSGVGELAIVVEDWNLQTALLECIEAQSLITRFGGRRCTGAQWTADAAIIELDDATRIQAALAVAADGADSRLREFAGIESDTKFYGQQGVVANFRASQSHRGTAFQWFRDDGVLALLPLPDNHVSMVWSTPEAHALELMALTPVALAARVSAASGGVLGELAAVGAAAAFPLRRMRAQTIVGPRVALAGDAAHNVHPLAGQGLNLGLADAEALGGILVERAAGEDPGSRAVLARYRRSRAEDIAAMEFATDGLQRLFASKLPGAAWLRNTGLRMTDRLLPLKRALVKRATG